MKAEDVMKALECCSKHPMKCKACPYQGIPCCTNEHRKDALALLREKDAEINRLRKAVDAWAGEAEEARAENVKLADERDRCLGALSELADNIGLLKDKADTVRKMQERLKERAIPVTGGKGFEGVNRMATNLLIDQIAKEMIDTSSDVVDYAVDKIRHVRASMLDEARRLSFTAGDNQYISISELEEIVKEMEGESNETKPG